MRLIQNGELPRPSAEQLLAMNLAWLKQAKINRVNLILSPVERDLAAQELLERSTNPDFKTDSQMK